MESTSLIGGIVGRNGAAVHMTGRFGQFLAWSVNVYANSIDSSLQDLVDEQPDPYAVAYRPSVLLFSELEQVQLSDVYSLHAAPALGGVTSALFEDVLYSATYSSRFIVEWHEWERVDTNDDAVLVFQKGGCKHTAVQLYSTSIELKRWRIKAGAPM